MAAHLQDDKKLVGYSFSQRLIEGYFHSYNIKYRYLRVDFIK